VALVLSAGAAFAEGASRAKTADDRWVPAFSFYSGAQVRNQEGRVSGPLQVEVGVPERGDELAVFAFTGMSLELSTPKLFSASGPRFFAHVDASLSFDSDRPIAGEGNPGPIEYPVNTAGQTLELAPVTGMLGQGTSLHSEAKPLVLSAGAGLSFEFKALGRTLRIKPSLEYMWQETQASVEVGYLVSTQVVTGSSVCSRVAVPQVPPGVAQPCASAFLSTSKTKAFHSLGPGIEIEMDTGRVGPVMLALYASGQAYRLLGDGEIDLNASEPLFLPDGFNPLGTPPGSLPAGVQDPVDVMGSVDLDPWHYRFGVGLRFRWLPK